MTRKRTRVETAVCPSKKKLKRDGNDSTTKLHPVVLRSCYANVLTLREYFLTRLPAASRVRRRRLESWIDPTQNTSLLDTCLVGVLTEPSPELQQERAREFAIFSQTQASARPSHTVQGQSCCIQDVVDFVIWLLFKKCPLTSNRPRHVLCNGLQKSAPVHPESDKPYPILLPGLFQQHPNESLNVLKKPQWEQYLSLLGLDGEVIISSLLFDCGLFLRIGDCNDNYLQISGTPIGDLHSLNGQRKTALVDKGGASPKPRKPCEISLNRSRILYAKPSLNKRGTVHFGFKPVHVLQRYTGVDDRQQTIHVMKHVFPRQFRFRNVFSPPNNLRDPSAKLPDFTHREDEFTNQSKHPKSWAPRRLRVSGETLIRKLRKRHSRCSITQLLRHYCPVASNAILRVKHATGCRSVPSSLSTAYITQSRISTPTPVKAYAGIPASAAESSFLSYSTPATQVSAFCKAVVSNILPRDCFGTGVGGQKNWAIFLRNVDRFVTMRRFESLSLHEVSHDLGIKCIEWLQPSSPGTSNKMSKSEFNKRLELLHEFVYYVFDSMLIPLLRSNFYVTETAVHRNKLYFFRHDVWRRLCEPSLAMLKLNLYAPMTPSEARQGPEKRSLGYSNVRLLPKADGVRPIINLKRRMIKSIGGRRVLGPSINAQLAPVFSTLGYERHQDPARLGGAIFSTSGLRDKLKEFKRVILPGTKLYFVKLDIQSCFDTIPQARLIEVMGRVLSHPQYRTARYTEFKSIEKSDQQSGGGVRQKFAGLAQAAEDEGVVLSEITAAQIVGGKNGSILVDSGNQKVWEQPQLIRLLQEHVWENVVKIGQRHFRQTMGIPQGSVLSSMLCSFFYSEFESRHLSFLTPMSSLLVRLIDDFLLITTDKNEAVEFLHTMLEGSREYGILVNPEKTLANFEVRVRTQKLPRCRTRDEFPYCGIMINTTSLEVSKDWQRKDRFVDNGLTVDGGRMAGRAFRRKALFSFKMQMQAMFLDANFNSVNRITATYMGAFEEAATKMHAYANNMRRGLRPSAGSMKEVVMEMINAACRLGQTRQPVTESGQSCNPVPRPQMVQIATMAFERVLLPKQTEYRHVLEWLRDLRASSETSVGTRQQALKRLVRNPDRVLEGCVY